MFTLHHIPSAEELIDNTFRAGSKEASKSRSTGKLWEKRIKKADEKRVKVVGKSIESTLDTIVRKFPSYEQLPVFYQKLIDIEVSKDRYKKSLGAVHWCSRTVGELKNKTLQKIKRGDSKASMEFMGRAASVVKQVSKDLDTLIEIKQKLLSFPTVEVQPTLVVAGYPNSGKSTFIKTLTGSKVKIAAYPFTTQSILIGHRKIRHQQYQVIDTPGLLDRPMEERSRIEQQAILALEYLADAILFLVDPLNDLEPQLGLLEELTGRFKVKIVVGINKTDVVDEKRVADLASKLKGYNVTALSAVEKENCERVFGEVFISGVTQ